MRWDASQIEQNIGLLESDAKTLDAVPRASKPEAEPISSISEVT